MKPLSLQFGGFNSFSDPASIDFRGLIDLGLFGIFGDTGSGKSTILDCIHFALYGAVARGGSVGDVINFRCDRAFVDFEFEIVYECRRRIFRVEREIKRKNNAQSVTVYERENGGLVALAEGFRDGNALLRQIIGLEQGDFEKCIALPQGEFAQFVKAQRGDRLKLISRLFDLDRYGTELVRRAAERSNRAENEYRILEERLRPFGDVTEESLSALGERIAALKAEEEQARAAAEKTASEEKEAEAALTGRREAEEAAAAFAKLASQKAEYDSLERELVRLEKTSAVLDAKREGTRLRERKVRADSEMTEVKARLARAEEAAAALPPRDADREAAEAERLAADAARAEAAEDTRKRKKSAEERLGAAIGAMSTEKDLFRGFSYDERRAALEKIIGQDGDLSAFIAAHGRAFFGEQYKTFADELDGLSEKYPVIREDSEPLARKYRELSLEGGESAEALTKEYAAREEEKKRAQRELVDLEKQRGKYELHLQRMQEQRAEFDRCKAEIAQCEELLRDIPSVGAARSALEEFRKRVRSADEREKRCESELSAARVAYAGAEERLKAAETALAEGIERYRTALAAGGFRSDGEAEELAARFGDPVAAAARLESYRSAYAAARVRSEAHPVSAYPEDVREKCLAAKERHAVAEEAVRECARALALADADLTRGKQLFAAKQTLEAQCRKAKEEYELKERLKKLLDGNKFMEFVAEEYLQTVALNASGRLLSLTDGRYFLRYDRGFFVGDNFNGGQLRNVTTLSGGETFLVSLSLALSLGAEICARSLRPIEFFFLDEGFGTLDASLVDTVMDSLEKLKSANFTIGIISHVEELKHRIEKKLIVLKATDRRGSQIKTE